MNQKFKATKELAAVTESLLPFINGPLRSTLDDKLRAAHLLNAKRYDKRFPQILKLPQSANSFEGNVIPTQKMNFKPKSEKSRNTGALYSFHKVSCGSFFLI